MRNFQGTFEKRNQSFISAFSICMTVPLKLLKNEQFQKEQKQQMILFVKKSKKKIEVIDDIR